MKKFTKSIVFYALCVATFILFVAECNGLTLFITTKFLALLGLLSCYALGKRWENELFFFGMEKFRNV